MTVELPNLPKDPTTLTEWQEAVDIAQVGLILATEEQGVSTRGEHEEYIERALDLIERGQALGIEPKEEEFEGDNK
jgi:hypothetical protein